MPGEEKFMAIEYLGLSEINGPLVVLESPFITASEPFTITIVFWAMLVVPVALSLEAEVIPSIA